MAGHFKWAQMKHKKAATDAAKSREFSRFSRLITLEAKRSGGNLSAPSLLSAIERAKGVNMPKDNIERAVQKGISKDAGELDQVAYEFYGPGGVAVIVLAVTDNKNRTTQEIKHLLTKNGYELGTPGSASWAFTKLPDGRYTPNDPKMEVTGADEEKISEILSVLDEHDDVQEVFTNANGYENTGD